MKDIKEKEDDKPETFSCYEALLFKTELEKAWPGSPIKDLEAFYAED